MLNLGVEVDLETSILSSYRIAAFQKEHLNSGPPKYKGSKNVLSQAFKEDLDGCLGV